MVEYWNGVLKKEVTHLLTLLSKGILPILGCPQASLHFDQAG